MRHRPLASAVGAYILGLALLAFETGAHAQSSDRDRAQMLQMQQQLQRLQSDNAALQRERGQLQDQAKDAERLKKEGAQNKKDLSGVRADATAAHQEASGLRAQLEAQRLQNDEQIAQWKKALEERDAALQAAASARRKSEAEIALLASRLKLQTGRADICEVKHAGALQFSQEVVDTYEHSRLRLCEPVTGIWRVAEEERIQALRTRLYDLRLDVPLPAKKAPETATAAPAPGAR